MAQLELIHDKVTSQTTPNVVFLHGLGGHAKETWMCDPENDTTLWPKWVGEEADCVTWVLGYDAALSSWVDEAMPLPDQGTTVLDLLVNEPELCKRPLVLVGHSMGGLVIKTALVHAMTHGVKRYEAIADRLAGIVFVATPHFGADLANLADALKRLLRTNEQVGNMKLHNAHLRSLNEQFRAQHQNIEFNVRTFAETRGVFSKWKLLGFSFGPRVVVVDPSSSDPHVSGETPIRLPEDHFSICKPKDRNTQIHKSLLGFLRELLATEGYQKALSKTAMLCEPALTEQICRASRDLLTWPTTLPGGEWLNRTEFDELRDEVKLSEHSLTLVLGEPGCGKSALLARLGQKMQSEGMAVLGIKADRLPEGILSQEALTQYLGLSIPVLIAIKALAKARPVLVLLDQLDALADLVVQHSARLRVLLNLIRDLHDIPNVHVVATCRSFEQRHDPSLRNLDATSLYLALPPWDEIDKVLQVYGVQAGGWNLELRETLRSPHALDTFLTLLGNIGELSVLHSFQSMLESQWESKVLCDHAGNRKTLLLDLAREMADREVLSLPLAKFEDRYATVQELEAAGLLRKAEGRIEFRHQTLYEFIRARSFLDEEGSLTKAVLEKQSSLRIRSQLWHALTYLRASAPDSYQVELRQLWQADLRRHLRMLLIEFIGKQPSPLAYEQQLSMQSLDDTWFKPRFLNAVVGSAGWFELLVKGVLPTLMARPATEAAVTIPILDQALGFSPEEVLSLIDRYWLPHPEKDELSWRVLAMGQAAPQNTAWVRRLEQILSRTELASWAIGHVAGTASMVLPNEAPRLIAAWLRYGWQKALVENPRVHSPDSDAAIEQDAEIGASAELKKQATALLEARELHDLPAIAEAAPQAFVMSIWPIFLELLDAVTADAHPFVIGYRDSHTLATALTDDIDSRLERPLIGAICLAVDAWAEVQSDAFLNFVNDQARHDLLTVQRLLAKGMARCAHHYPTQALEFLCADPRRFVLGSYEDVHRDSIALIQAVAPHLNEAQLQQLEQTIVNWKRYSAYPDDDAKTRLERLKWGREHRLRLLRALPKERMTPTTHRLVNEEERAFPHLNDKDVTSSGFHAIGSSVSAEQMLKGQDEDILNLFSELTDEHGWDHPRKWMNGGSIQAGRELANLAKTNPERAVGLIRALPPEKNEIPVGDVLEALADSGYAPRELYTLIEEFVAKGFSSDHFRRDVAGAVRKVVSADNPVPESLLDMLESWLISAAPESQDIATDEKPEKREGSLLWGHGGILVHPSGNFPMLDALSVACLNEPPRIDRWLTILERHLLRSESVSIWGMIGLSYLKYLDRAEPVRAQSFLDRLFHSYPAMLGRPEVVLLMANLQHWITVENAQRWLGLMANSGGYGHQGFGEVLMFRHALFPQEQWPREQVAALLSATESAKQEQRVGIAHVVAHLWLEPTHRSLSHGYLLRLLENTETDTLNALGAIFLADSLLLDSPTQELLDTLCLHPMLLNKQSANHLSEHLEAMVAIEPARVARLANVLLDQVGEALGNLSTSWYLSTESLLDIAMALQDLGEPHRTAGMALFERMLEFNLPQAQEMTISLDKRTPMRGAAPMARRRIRKKHKST